MIQQRRHLMVPALTFGSGGGIRTPDLWVMSPTSCRCSTPRRVRGYLAMSQELLALGSDRLPDASTPRVGGARGGLASRGVAPTVLSGAALGHDRVRDGTGWGQHALGHGHPPPPARRRRGGLVCATPAATLLSDRPRALPSTITEHATVGPARRWRDSAAAGGGVLTSPWRGPLRCRATTPDVHAVRVSALDH